MSPRLLSLALLGGLAACTTPSADHAAGEAISHAPRASAAPGSAAATPAAPGPERASPALTRVEDTSQVCMVTNQFMGTTQIPVQVDGRTYYGCCEMCKARLASEPATRTATDPVSGETVDKAKAVIGRDAAGKVHYFASADHLARFRPMP